MAINKLIHFIAPSLLRYTIVGFVSLTADYIVFMLLYRLFGINTAIAVPAGLTVGLVVNFMLNKLWSFGNRDHLIKQYIKQVIYYIVLVIINSVFTYFFIELLRINNLLDPEFSKLFATAITTLWNYVLYKKIIFRSDN